MYQLYADRNCDQGTTKQLQKSIRSLKNQLANIDDGIANAKIRDDFAQSLLLTQQRQRIVCALEGAQTGIFDSEGYDDRSDEEKVILEDEDGKDTQNLSPISISGGLSSDTDSNNKVDVLHDNIELRARLVQMEKHLRELDLRIISAIGDNNFTEAKELNEAKKVNLCVPMSLQIFVSMRAMHIFPFYTSVAPNLEQEVQGFLNGAKQDLAHKSTDSVAKASESDISLEDKVAYVQKELQAVQSRLKSASIKGT